jgi:hypothetical protein
LKKLHNSGLVALVENQSERRAPSIATYLSILSVFRSRFRPAGGDPRPTSRSINGARVASSLFGVGDVTGSA